MSARYRSPRWSRGQEDDGRRHRRLIIIVLIYLLTAALSVAASAKTVLPGDVGASRFVRYIEFAGVARLERAGYFLGSFYGVVAAGLVLIALLALTRHFASAGLIIGALILRGSNRYIKGILESPRPPADLVRVAENATGDPGSFGYPSGHVMGSVLLYGSIIYILQIHLRPGWLRIALQLIALVLIVVVGWSRIYSGAHWLTDVIGGVLWGIALLVPLIAMHRRKASRPRNR